MVDPTKPHRRLNPLTNEWILVSPHRTKRPWNGAVEQNNQTPLPPYDPSCYLCPGNLRANNERNPVYGSTHVFTNDHASLIPEVGNQSENEHDLLVSQQENGTSRVICYSPAHNRTMAKLTIAEIETVIHTWTHEYKIIGNYPDISYIQIFENKGPAMGASNPHPHCQIWANEHIPTIPQKEQNAQLHYMKTHQQNLLVVYETLERKKGERIVTQNDDFTVVVPYWATWPYETMILPKTHLSNLTKLTPKNVTSLAAILSTITKAYDRVFDAPFPYSMGIHQAPTDNKEHDEWQFHMHFYPPLLRSATIKKHFVGYEMMAEAQRDISPEAAAETLRRYI